jgi:hypothetical protein
MIGATVSPNENNIRLWVDGLRSGQFAQGQMRLTRINEDGNQFDCCMGVACKVAVNNGVEVEVVEDEISVMYDGEEEFLPLSVQDWLGFEGHNPVLDPNPDSHESAPDGLLHAAEANDDKKWTFEQIADALERVYL